MAYNKEKEYFMVIYSHDSKYQFFGPAKEVAQFKPILKKHGKEAIRLLYRLCHRTYQVDLEREYRTESMTKNEAQYGFTHSSSGMSRVYRPYHYA